MNVLLDENLPRRLKFRLLEVGHTVQTVRDLGWQGLKNGALLRQAAAAGFEVLVTTDRNLPKQQNRETLPVAVVILRVQRLKYSFLQPFLPQLIELLPTVRTGQVYEISPASPTP